MAYFVFLEFANPQVRAFLTELREALGHASISSPVHVTLRGPYRTPPRKAQLDEFAQRLRGHGVRVANQGYFVTPKGFSVFMRAECTVFKEMWDKPDFRVPLDSIEPHITIFESQNRAAAQTVLDFLRRAQIWIHTYDVYLRVYSSRKTDAQIDFFGPELAVPPGKPILKDVWRNIPAEVLERARELGQRIHVPDVPS